MASVTAADTRYLRIEVPEERPRERIGDFREVLHSYTREEAMLEAQRCLQCALPFCVEACPITQDCRGYIGLVADGRFDEASRLTLRENPLATTLCKVCYHYCEDACIMKGRGVPIAIRHLKRAALEFGDSSMEYVPSAPRQQRVAVIGAGPAGLMAAWELCLRGYPVTVFERQSAIGGQAGAIPRYRMPNHELLVDLQRYRNFDLTFVTDRTAGVDFTPESLLAEGYRAVFVSIGASKAGYPGVPGEHLPGVLPALEFLYDVNQGRPVVLGRKIVVIGGGDVAVDSVRSARRIAPGATVAMAYRRTREESPAGEEEIRETEPEGIDFHWLVAPVQILGTDRVEGAVFQRMELATPDASGRRAVKPIDGAFLTIECDTVIMAVGEKADLSGFDPKLGLKIGTKGWPEGSGPGYATAREGVFAAGGRSVVHAMAAGTKAAESIDAFLAEKDHRAASPRPDPFGEGDPPPPFPEGYSSPVWKP
ncbi:MAG TPA: FAD-dependent oxidoreductase [Thermoplasmata archaeon]|nr:FAD-dependent oxidoreductase [Thermoplasmata archaeon]